MFSNLDTDSIVKALTSGEQTKIDDVQKKQTKQGWLDDAITSVQDEVNTFLNTYVNNSGSNSMLNSATYETIKATTPSTSNSVSVTASTTADTGDYSIQVNTLAKRHRSSSGKVSKDGPSVSASNTATLASLSLANNLQFDSGGNISFGINGKTFTFSSSTTLQSMINTVNSDTTANVTMTYSRLSDTFSIAADSGGADSSVAITNYSGNAFGANSAFQINTGTLKNGTDSVAVINGNTITQDSNNYNN